ESVFEVLLSFKDIPDWLLEKVESREEAFKKLKKMKASEAIDYIEGHMGYKEHLEYRISCGYRAEQLNQKLDILRTLAAREATITCFLERLDQLESVLKENKRDFEADVTFSTIHSSKGLEFEKVFIIDAVEGEFPSLAAMDEDEEGKRLFCEEVRLFYVGVTRAKKELEFISVGKKNSRFSKRPVSQFVKTFLSEKPPEREKEKTNRIAAKKTASKKQGFGHFDVSVVRKPHVAGKDVDYSAYKQGTQVMHRGFGAGIIKEVKGDMVTIQFESCGFKKLNLEICVLNGIINLHSL
ncbi:MAG: 3'-5' exonuclease, partial [Eubacterium sp.]